jgi:hypothetical protein
MKRLLGPAEGWHARCSSIVQQECSRDVLAACSAKACQLACVLQGGALHTRRPCWLGRRVGHATLDLLYHRLHCFCATCSGWQGPCIARPLAWPNRTLAWY